MKFTDARNAKRAITVVDVAERGCWAEATQTAYVVPGTVLRHERGVAKADEREARVGDLPPCESAIILRQGDLLILTRDLKLGRPATYDSGGQILAPAAIGCTIPEVFDDVRSGESIWFDDGKIGGVVQKVENTQVLVRITHAHLRGEKLRGDKGINLPESDLRLGAMTAKDLEDLSFVAQYADVVELSFANSARDVELLQQHLARLGSRQPAIVLKIEWLAQGDVSPFDVGFKLNAIPMSALQYAMPREAFKAASAIPRSDSATERNPDQAVQDSQGIGTIPVGERIYQFKIALLGINPPIWRRIHTKDCTLDKLHSHVQLAMGWENSHLHHFMIDGKRYGACPSLPADWSQCSLFNNESGVTFVNVSFNSLAFSVPEAGTIHQNESSSLRRKSAVISVSNGQPKLLFAPATADRLVSYGRKGSIRHVRDAAG